MPGYTLLDIVQSVLSDMGSDKVNSISDTIESDTIASTAQDVFYRLCTYYNIKGLKSTFRLDASTDPQLPIIMTLPFGVKALELVKYNNKHQSTDPSRWQEINYLTPQNFLELVQGRNSDSSTVEEVSLSNNVPLLAYNNSPPTYYTSFDDNTLVFDSYNSAIESTLQKSNTTCYGLLYPNFQKTDGYVIELPNHFQPLFLMLVKQASLKEPNAILQREIIKMRSHLRKLRDITPDPTILPDYSRPLPR